jgi:hypothetical protein
MYKGRVIRRVCITSKREPFGMYSVTTHSGREGCVHAPMSKIMCGCRSSLAKNIKKKKNKKKKN